MTALLFNLSLLGKPRHPSPDRLLMPCCGIGPVPDTRRWRCLPNMSTAQEPRARLPAPLGVLSTRRTVRWHEVIFDLLVLFGR